MENDKLIQIKEAARILGISPETLRRWDRQGKLTAVKVGSRKDRKYRLSDIQTILESEKNDNTPKAKGNFLESFAYELIERLAKEWNFALLENRHQKSGQQYGKDHIIKWSGAVEGEHFTFEWAIEDKHVGTKDGVSQIDSDSIRSKLLSIDQYGLAVDCWCVFSPFGYVDNDFRQIIDSAKVARKYKFNIILWTSDKKIEDLIACFPDLYKKLYGKEKILTPEQRNVILSAWKEQIINETKEGKALRNNIPTQQKLYITGNVSSQIAKEVAKELSDDAVKASIYSSSDLKGVSTAQMNAKQSAVSDEIDKALVYLNKGNTEEAKTRLFIILGRIESETRYKHELARVYNNLGVAFNIEKDTDKAIDYFKKAVDTEDDFLIALGNLASTQLIKCEELIIAKAKDEEIKHHLQKAKDIILPLWKTFDKNPNPLFLQKYMQLIRLESGTSGLITFLKEQLKGKYKKLFSTNGTLAYLVGEAFLSNYEPEEALIYAEISCQLEKDIETLTLRGRTRIALALKNDLDFSKEDYKDLTPKFRSRKNLLKAVHDFDEAMDIALREEKSIWYAMIYYLQKMGRLWLGDSFEIPKPTSLNSESAFYGEGLVKAVEEFRKGNIEQSYELLKVLPEFASMPYPELFRYGRVYLNNGYPEIALEIFKMIENQSLQHRDFMFWMDYSVIFVLLEEKNKAILAAARAREFAQGNNRRIAFSHFGAVMLRYASDEGGDRMLENTMLFDKEFPELKVVEAFNYEKDKEKIIGMFKDRQTWIEKIKKLYNENPVPTYYLQIIFKKPYVTVWSRRDPEIPFAYTLPSKEFAEELENNYKKGEIFTLDYLSLLTISKLNLLTDLEQILPKMQIPFSLFQKIQDELMQEENPDLRKLWNFLRKKKTINIVRKIPQIKVKSKIWTEILEPWLVDAIKLSKNKKTTMVTDDFRLFRYFKGDDFKLVSINSWLILQKSKEKELIDSTMYAKAIGKLAECYYQFISFNGDELFTIIADDDFKLSPRSYHLINQVFLPDSDFNSFGKVFSKFILNIWRPGLILEDKLFWLKYITEIYSKFVESKIPNGTPALLAFDTGPSLGELWGVAILSSTKEELAVLIEKINDLMPQLIFSKVKDKVLKVINERLEKLK